MKMKNLAMAVATTFIASGSAYAAQVYSGDGTSLAVGGYVDVGLGEKGSIYSDPNFQVHEISPRLNIEGKKEIGNGVTVDAKAEWTLNFVEGGEETFATRLGYIGATHEQAGRLVVGTQWSPYYDVAGVADKPIAFGNDFLYPGQYNLGTARAEKMVSYRNKLEITQDLSISLGLGWQGEQTVKTLEDDSNGAIGSVTYTRIAEKFDARGQVAVGVQFAGVGLGYVYNSGDVNNESLTFQAVSAYYGNYGKGVYAAVVYGNVDDDEFNSEMDQYEALVAYGLDNGLNIIANYEAVEENKGVDTLYSQAAVQFEYTISSGFVGFAAYQFDLGNDINKNEDDQYTIGARYFF